MGARNTASSQSGREGSASRSSSVLFADSYKPRRVSGFALAVVILSATGAGALMLYWYLGATDYSRFPIVGQAIASFDRSALLAVACVSFVSCVPIAVAAIWLRRYMPWGFQIEWEIIKAFQDAGLVPPSMRTEDFRYKLKVKRFERRAEFYFTIRRLDSGLAEIQGRTRGLDTALEGLRKYSFAEVNGRLSGRYRYCLVLEYGDNHVR